MLHWRVNVWMRDRDDNAKPKHMQIMGMNKARPCLLGAFDGLPFTSSRPVRKCAQEFSRNS